MENKSSNASLIVMTILIVIAAISIIGTIGSYTIVAVCMLLSLIFVALYTFWLYKKPHGNILKWAFVLFAIATIITNGMFLYVSIGNPYTLIIGLIVSAFICYCAGRLDRIEQNKYILVVGDIIYLIIGIIWIIQIPGKGMYSVLMYPRLLINPIVLSALIIAYNLRYKDHKEAGLVDAPKE